MDLNVHRAMLWLALERLSRGPRAGEYFVPAAALAERLLHPIWLGNWATDMNQASAFFDVLDSKYRDPYQRWRTDGTYEFPQGIADHKGEWVRMFDALWAKECEAMAASPEFQGIRPPQGVGFTDADAIGGYYPLDHFDVADRMAPECPGCHQLMRLSDDQSEWRCGNGHPRLPTGQEGACAWGAVPDSFEYEGASERLSHSVRRAVFSECLWGPLHVALQGDRGRPANLRHLGKALHVLQDLYAHSNYAELLVLGARGLPPALGEALRRERTGSFASYIQDPDPASSVVVSGRFDQVDTVASILRIYRESLIPRWKDLEAGGYLGDRGRTRDLMVEVLFGTFSNMPYAGTALEAVKGALEVKDFLTKVGDWVTRGAIKFFGGVAKLLEPEAAAGIGEVQALLLAANDVQARDYAKAGRILYLERVIEKRLEDELAEKRRTLGPSVLPHHTLLAKDQDTAQPECRLVFKLSCLLATDLTADVLTLYLTGAGHKDFEELLRRRVVHPSTLLKDDARTARALQEVVPRIYGERWWQVSRAPGNVLLQ